MPTPHHARLNAATASIDKPTATFIDVDQVSATGNSQDDKMIKIEKSSKRGAKPGERRGGRKKGTPNVKNAAWISAMKASGLPPLKYMLALMRDPNAPFPERLRAAKAAAPYVHRRLAAVKYAGQDGGPIDSH